MLSWIQLSRLYLNLLGVTKMEEEKRPYWGIWALLRMPQIQVCPVTLANLKPKERRY